MVVTFPPSDESGAKVVAMYLFPSSRALCNTSQCVCNVSAEKCIGGEGRDNYSACYVGREGAGIYCIAIVAEGGESAFSRLFLACTSVTWESQVTLDGEERC